ncbi:NUDIX domain-containing protein [Actinopolymorpha alba]|uniref:NUDIX domain-containing protein n=1 Tax=Actinopolymorpha alba TaxID=533267 RepID=UPI0003662B57|nr:NUDIX hydrolase [Actinopolymorpha alba]
MSDRRRVGAVIVRDQSVLMVRQRGVGPSGRHDGPEYWTLPGGGIEQHEDVEAALIREVREEVGLTVRAARYLRDLPYPSTTTAYYWVDVDGGEPVLGVDDDLDCGCPRMVGLDWVPMPSVRSETGGLPIAPLIYAWARDGSS